MNQTVLNIDPEIFWGIVSLSCVILACILSCVILACIAVVTLMPWAGHHKNDPLEQLKSSMGLASLHTGIFLIISLFWLGISLLLAFGLAWLIWEMLWLRAFEANDVERVIRDWRFALTKLAAFTATLGALVALPVTLQRLRITQHHTTTAAETLFSEKINVAIEDLHARRLVTKNPHDHKGRWDYWQDDIVRRNAAIDRLEVLTIEHPRSARRISRMLCIYVRELSAENTAEPVPQGISPDELRAWAASLSACRSDMENAAQTLGRLQRLQEEESSRMANTIKTAAQSLEVIPAEAAMQGGVEIDLRGANLQRADLNGVSLHRARMQGTQMQGAFLPLAQLQHADLGWAQMQGAVLSRAQMQEANLHAAQMQGADLHDAQMQGADLGGAQMDCATSIGTANLWGAMLREADYSDVAITQAQVDTVFYDGSVTFSDAITRAPGRDTVLGRHEFYEQWRAWQQQTGFNCDAGGG